MVSISLELADNGVIKTIKDDNYNGAGELYEGKRVFEIDVDPTHEKKLEFIYSLCRDLGLDLGNDFSNNVLKFDIGWGNDYNPTVDELEKKVNLMKAEMKLLTSTLKNIKEKDTSKVSSK